MAVDHPVTQEASRGPKSRAGLIAYPDRAPRLIPITTTARPMMNGAMLAPGALLRAAGRVGDGQAQHHQRGRADDLAAQPAEDRQPRPRRGRVDALGGEGLARVD